MVWVGRLPPPRFTLKLMPFSQSKLKVANDPCETFRFSADNNSF